jgi:hypothetical protein
LGDVQRIVQLGRHLAQPPRSGDYIVFLGDSVTREGIDASIVEAAGQSRSTIENLALSGCGVNEQRVLLPKVLQAGPEIVVLAFRPSSLTARDDLVLDKAYAYAMSEFPMAWPESYGCDDFPAFSQSTLDALESSPIRQWLHFRTAPLNWLNSRLRSSLRTDLRGGTSADWIRPFQRLGSVSNETMDWHLESLRQGLKSRGEPDSAAGAASIRHLVATVQRGGATPVLVILPIHPRLRDDVASLLPRLRQLLTELADLHHGKMIDASGVLTESQFADAIHPNAQGREVYSRFIGERLPP